MNTTPGVTAVYPGTFDPMTLGHVDLVRRASGLFSSVIVAVAAGHHKRALFDLDERLAMAQEACSAWPQVRVMPFEGLLRDFVVGQGARVVVRGLRAVSDFDYEFQMQMRDGSGNVLQESGVQLDDTGPGDQLQHRQRRCRRRGARTHAIGQASRCPGHHDGLDP